MDCSGGLRYTQQQWAKTSGHTRDVCYAHLLKLQPGCQHCNTSDCTGSIEISKKYTKVSKMP